VKFDNLQKRENADPNILSKQDIVVNDSQNPSIALLQESKDNLVSAREKLFNIAVTLAKRYLISVDAFVGIKDADVCLNADVFCETFWAELLVINEDLNEDEFLMSPTASLELPLLSIIYMCCRESSRVSLFIALAIRLLLKLSREIDSSISHGQKPAETYTTAFFEASLKLGIMVDDWKCQRYEASESLVLFTKPHLQNLT